VGDRSVSRPGSCLNLLKHLSVHEDLHLPAPLLPLFNDHVNVTSTLHDGPVQRKTPEIHLLRLGAGTGRQQKEDREQRRPSHRPAIA